MTNLSNGFVCIMGMGTVFIGLICIVFICMLLSVVVRAFSNSVKTPAAAAVHKAEAPKEAALLPAEKQAVVAGVCAAIAEELGTDASNIKVLSFKKV